MGQKLVIEVVDKIKEFNGNIEKRVVANATYHWGGYTKIAANYTKNIVNFFRTQKKEDFKDPVIYAVKGLECGDAGFLKSENALESEYKKADILTSIAANKIKFRYFYPPEKYCMGEIFFLEDDVFWAPYKAKYNITIDLIEKKVKFGVYRKITEEEFIKEGGNVDEVNEYWVDIESLSFKHVAKFADILCNNEYIKLSPYPGYYFAQVK